MTRGRIGWVILAGLLVAGGFATLGSIRGALDRVVGDEGTYLGMIASLALDGDLTFGEEDRERVASAPRDGRRALILQRAGERMSYSKPLVYPLLAAPAYWLAGEPGLIAFNIVVLLAALGLAYGYLRLLGSSQHAAWTLLTFAGASVIVPYTVYRMSDLLQVALAIAGGSLCLAGARAAASEVGENAGPAVRIVTRRWAPWVGGVLLGLLGMARLPNFLLAAGIGCALLLAGHWRKAVATWVGALAVSGAVAMVGYGTVGVANPYKADRATFNEHTGYPERGYGPIALEQFNGSRKTQRLTVKPEWAPAVSRYAAAYFAIGRHTGALVYFPALIALIAAAIARPDRLGLTLLATAAGGIVFFLVWMPGNYFGGSTFIGNRYFLTLYPLFLLALGRLPGKRVLITSWVVGLTVFGSALLSAERTREIDPLSQSHAHAGIFRWLPFESTAIDIDGRRDRYWSGDFLRFQDFYARVEDDGWLLQTDRPGSDVEVVSQHAGNRLTFLVRSPSEPVSFVVADWKGRSHHPVAAAGDGAGQLVTVETSEPWRRHPFWWLPDVPYQARLLRLSVRTEGEPTKVEIRYLGTTLEGMFDYKVHKGRLPESAPAGETTTLSLRLRNMSNYPWYRAGVVPVVVGFGFFDPESGSPVGERQRLRLPHDVISGDPVDLEIPVDWPAETGAYRMSMDLEYGWIAAFAEHVGKPLAEAVVTVE